MEMAGGSSLVSEPKPEGWGGSWTERKLAAFEKYVKAYLTIMAKHNYWKTIYYDGFAGSGDRRPKEDHELMDQLSIVEEEEFVYRGAAERLLRLPDKWRFDWYYFIDRDEAASRTLQQRLTFVQDDLRERLVFRPGDSNEQLMKLAAKLKDDKSFASLVFLDPFGMQVRWESIAALEGTRTDIWILIPTGVIVNRLLDRKGGCEASPAYVSSSDWMRKVCGARSIPRSTPLRCSGTKRRSFRRSPIPSTRSPGSILNGSDLSGNSSHPIPCALTTVRVRPSSIS